jgi:orotate phosphoribosyltransferase
VRKAAKEHGARERIDGFLRDGAEVLMIDDVATKASACGAAWAFRGG